MNRPSPASTPPATELENAARLLVEIRAALDTARAPRSVRRLKDAARLFREHGDCAQAVEALILCGRLEAARGNPRSGVSSARAALRQARAGGAPGDIEAALDLLAELYTEAGEHGHARKAAEEWVRRSAIPTPVPALLRLACVEFAGGEIARAAEHLECALARAGTPEAEATLAGILVRAGCPTAAAERATRALKQQKDALPDAPALMQRALSWLVLGRMDAAARDFRRAGRTAAEAARVANEAEAIAGAAAAEALRATAEGNAARAERAARLRRKAARMAKRVRSPLVQRRVEALEQLASDTTPSLQALAGPDLKAAAQSLLALARSTQSRILVDACVAEVERMSRLPESAPAYALNPHLLPPLV